MKELYKKIVAKLDAMGVFIWIDRDKGELDDFNIRPPLSFPACLVRFDVPNIEDVGDGSQVRDVRITLRLAFDYYGETSGKTPGPDMDAALIYFDLIEQVEAELNQWEDSTMNEWLQQGYEEELRPDGLQVTNLTFNTSFRFIPESE